MHSHSLFCLAGLSLSCMLKIQRNEGFITSIATKSLSSCSTTAIRTNKSISTSLFAVKKKTSKNKKSNNNNADNKNNISPMLAQWVNAANDDTGNTSTTTTASITASESKVEEEIKPIDNKDKEKEERVMHKSKTTAKKKKQKLSNRREKQVQRKEEETKRLKIELTLIKKLRLLLGDMTEKEKEELKKSKSSSSAFSTNDILSIINQLVENSSSDSINSNANSNNNVNVRNIAASNKNNNQYRMIWAGSDNAVCHVGSGLHNVPLARLQEVFISFFKSTIEVYEVIRIIGPFPNVKNTLKGDITYKGDSIYPSIKYTSMIDGTGKEILAGKQENQKIVPLDVILATDNIIVWKKPDGDGNDNGDSSNENGEDMLIFIRELDMDSKLDILRVL